MAKNQKGNRTAKKEVNRRFEKCFDTKRLDYQAKVKLIKPKSTIIGLGTASGLYMVGFALIYIAMSNNTLPLDVFSKLVWVMMIPTTIVGFFAWQLSRNRLEYPYRQEIREYMSELEKDGGLLWRFAPVLELTDHVGMNVKKASIPEKLVNRQGQLRSNAKRSAVLIGSRAKVGDGS